MVIVTMFTLTEALQINTVFGHTPCAKASLNLVPEYLAKIWPIQCFLVP